nr:hypothetical protein [Tanacetum cinerariifolium]
LGCLDYAGKGSGIVGKGVDVVEKAAEIGEVVLQLDRSLLTLGPNRLCARVPSKDDTPFHTQACKEYTRWMFYKLRGRPIVHHLVYLTRKLGFDLWSFQEFFSNHDWIPQLPTSLWMIRGGETMGNAVFTHDLCKLVIAKMSTAITYDSSRGTKSGEERFKELVNNSSVIGGERFRFNLFQQIIDGNENIFVPP